MEYATLSRAFATAKVPTVMATLWKISDKYTPVLIRSFYKHITAGDDRLTALAKAQREMIASDDKGQMNPANWSGFIIFGKP
jgi:CHAT domain-containing protein